MMIARVCTRCKEEKSLSDFHSHHNSRDGRRSECKVCICEKKKVSYQANKDGLLEKRRRYRAHNKEKVKASRRRHYGKNRETILAKSKKIYNDNPEKFTGSARRNKLLSSYGLTADQYDLMLANQDGKCAICGGPPVLHKYLTVDHCHTTERVRGLLCLNCNTGLGHFKESATLLQKAIKYLRHAP